MIQRSVRGAFQTVVVGVVLCVVSGDWLCAVVCGDVLLSASCVLRTVLCVARCVDEWIYDA